MPRSRPASRSGWSRNRAAAALLAVLLAPSALAEGVPDAQRLNEEGNDLFRQKRYAEALVRFEGAFSLAPGSAALRRNVAETCAALGSAASGEGRWADAARRYARAASLEPGEPRFRLWLGMAREEGGEAAEAEADYRKAAELAPEDPKPPARLGSLLVRQNRLQEAVPVLEKALALSPEDPGLAALLAQARRDQRFESGLAESGVSQFDVVFDGVANAEAAQRVLSMLLTAQTEVGNDLGLPQREKVRVILYTAREYADVTHAPEWAAAHYDGKIRLPIKDLDQRERQIRATVYHEYVHALIRESLPKCPSWLHEGLAQAAEFGRVLGADAEASRLRALSSLKGEELIPLARLEAPIASLPGGAIALAYAESLSFVRYLERRFGQASIQVFLGRWKEDPRRPYREVFRDAYGAELDELEKDWKESLR